MSVPIQIKHITKHYGRAKQPAVDNLSLAIERGEVYGLLGSNGAGKSTTIRMIMDFIRPTKGQIRLLGKDVQHNADVRAKVGYLAGDVVVPKSQTGKEFLHYLGRLSGSVDHEYFTELVRRFEVQMDKKMGDLSKGNRQKIGIVQAFMHQPDILILDEPTSGLDPLMQENFYQTVSEAKQRGAAILLSSHSFEEVERMCDRIGIVRLGKFVYEGKASDILATRKPRWRVTFKTAAAAEKLTHDQAVTCVDHTDVSVTVEPRGSIEAALKALSHYEIVSMTTSQHALEDEFLHFYEEEHAA